MNFIEFLNDFINFHEISFPNLIFWARWWKNQAPGPQGPKLDPPGAPGSPREPRGGPGSPGRPPTEPGWQQQTRNRHKKKSGILPCLNRQKSVFVQKWREKSKKIAKMQKYRNFALEPRSRELFACQKPV